MNNLTKLKEFLVVGREVNPNVVHSLIDGAIAEVVADVATYKTAGTPAATPVAGAVPVGTEIVLSSNTAGATIYYTIDGTTPTDDSLQYVAPIVIEEGVTIKAIAYKGYQTPSSVLSATYTIAQVATPVADPVAGAVDAGTEVTLTSTTEGATIYYTTDGTAPTDESLVYAEAIIIAEATTIKAIAYADNYVPSEVLTAAYTITA